MRKELGGVVGTLRAVSPRLIACVGCAGIAFGFALVPAANAAIVTNGDFATGDFTGWTLFTTANGSLGESEGLPAVTSFNVTGAGAQNAATFQVGEVVPGSGQQGGGITQTVTLPGRNLAVRERYGERQMSILSRAPEAGTKRHILQIPLTQKESSWQDDAERGPR
jgi:hypothetical protein